MPDSEELVTTIDKLKNFPFGTLADFWNEYQARRIEVQLDHGVARQWALRSLHSPPWLRRSTFALTFSPYIVMLLYATLIAFAQNWIYPLPLPILFKAPDFFRPNATATIPALILTFALLILSIIFALWELVALSLCLLILWQASNLVYYLPLKFLWKGGLNDEHVISMFWQGNALSILYPNDDVYSQRFKVINGKHTWHS